MSERPEEFSVEVFENLVDYHLPEEMTGNDLMAMIAALLVVYNIDIEMAGVILKGAYIAVVDEAAANQKLMH